MAEETRINNILSAREDFADVNPNFSQEALAEKFSLYAQPEMSRVPTTPTNMSVAPGTPGMMNATEVAQMARDLGVPLSSMPQLSQRATDMMGPRSAVTGTKLSYADMRTLADAGFGGMDAHPGQTVEQVLASRSAHDFLNENAQSIAMGLMPAPAALAMKLAQSLATGEYGAGIGGFLGSLTGSPLGSTVGSMVGKGLQYGEVPSSAEIGGRLMGALGSQIGGQLAGQVGYNALGQIGGMAGGMVGSKVGGALGGYAGSAIGGAIGYGGSKGTGAGSNTAGESSGGSTSGSGYSPSGSDGNGWGSWNINDRGFNGSNSSKADPSTRQSPAPVQESITGGTGEFSVANKDFIGGNTSVEAVGSMLTEYLSSIGQTDAAGKKTAATKTRRPGAASINGALETFVGGKYNADKAGIYNGFNQSTAQSGQSNGWFS